MTMPPLVDLTCRAVTELITDYMSAGAMPAAERAQFELHLHACTWCMTYFKQLEHGVHAMAALGQADVAVPSFAANEAELLARFRGWHAHRGAPEEPALQARAEPAARPPEPTAKGADEGARYAFKFLERGARGPISGFRWPVPSRSEPGAWVETPATLAPCVRGIHAARAHELAHWLHDELWVIELAGARLDALHGVVAARGRLVREIEPWSRGAGARFAQAAVDHAAELAAGAPALASELAPYLASAARHLPRGNTALAAFCAAMAAARLAGRTRFDQAGYDDERIWQSGWLARELNL